LVSIILLILHNCAFIDRIIANVKIFGDFFSKKDAGLFEKSLINVKHDKSSLQNVLAAIKTTDYFLNFTESEIFSMFF